MNPIFIPFSAWALMVLIGIIHAEVLYAVNPVGYGTALALMVVVWVFALPFLIEIDGS